MARTFKPDDLDRAKEEIDYAAGTGTRRAKEAQKERRKIPGHSLTSDPARDQNEQQNEARKDARGKVDEIFGLNEPGPGGIPESHINLPNGAKTRLTPNADDPYDIDISASTGKGESAQPLDIAAATGKPQNASGGVTVDPRDVVDTLGKINSIDTGKAAKLAVRGDAFQVRR
jgi:hypothetical protein